MNNQLVISFTETRFRRSDQESSRDAAKNAAGTKAADERIAIRQALEQFRRGLTAREIAAYTGIEYIETQRRLSEVAGIERSGERRDGCMVWRAV